MGTQQAGPGPTFDAAAFAAALAVPAQNAAANVDAVDVVGNKTDTVAGTSIVSLSRQVLALGPVPAQNAAANVSFRDVIGNKTDDENGTSIMSGVYVLQNHIHGINRCYPTLAAGVTAIAGPNPWVLPVGYTAVVPAMAIGAPFDIHHIDIEAISNNATYELFFYSGVANALIGHVRFNRVTAAGMDSAVPIITPIVAANEPISCRLASSGGAPQSVTFTVMYHTY